MHSFLLLLPATVFIEHLQPDEIVTVLHGLICEKINKNPKEFRENPRYCNCFSYMLASLIITPDRCVRPKTIKWKI